MTSALPPDKRNRAGEPGDRATNHVPDANLSA